MNTSYPSSWGRPEPIVVYILTLLQRYSNIRTSLHQSLGAERANLLIQQIWEHTQEQEGKQHHA